MTTIKEALEILSCEGALDELRHYPTLEAIQTVAEFAEKSLASLSAPDVGALKRDYVRETGNCGEGLEAIDWIAARGLLADPETAKKAAAYDEIMPLLDALIETRKKATTGPWMRDVHENVGQNWLISSGWGDDPDGTTPIMTTDCVPGSEYDSEGPSADIDFCVLAANTIDQISRAKSTTKT